MMTVTTLRDFHEGDHVVITFWGKEIDAEVLSEAVNVEASGMVLYNVWRLVYMRGEKMVLSGTMPARRKT